MDFDPELLESLLTYLDQCGEKEHLTSSLRKFQAKAESATPRPVRELFDDSFNSLKSVDGTRTEIFTFRPAIRVIDLLTLNLDLARLVMDDFTHFRHLLKIAVVRLCERVIEAELSVQGVGVVDY